MLSQTGRLTHVLVSFCYFFGSVLGLNPTVRSDDEKVEVGDTRETTKQRQDAYARTVVHSCLFLLRKRPKWIVRVYHDGTGDPWVTHQIDKLPNAKMCRVPDLWPAEAMVLSRFLPFGAAAYKDYDILVVDTDLLIQERHLQMFDDWKGSSKRYGAVDYGLKAPNENVRWLAGFVCAGTDRSVVACSRSLQKWVDNPSNLTHFHRDEYWLTALLGADGTLVFSDPNAKFSLPMGGTSGRARGSLKADVVRVCVKPHIDARTQDLCNISAMYGHDAASDKYAVSFEGDQSGQFRWLDADQMVGISSSWLELAKQEGQPKKSDTIKGQYRCIKRGVLTRSQLSLKVSTCSTGVTGSPVKWQRCDGSFCTSFSYLNLAQPVLSKHQVSMVEATELSASSLANLVSKRDFPVRMRAPRTFTGAPRQQGDYMVSNNNIHFDGVRVLPNGQVICFPTDSRTSEFVLSSDHDYVKKLLSGSYEAIALFNADRSEHMENKAQKRARLRKDKREHKRQKK